MLFLFFTIRLRPLIRPEAAGHRGRSFLSLLTCVLLFIAINKLAVSHERDSVVYDSAALESDGSFAFFPSCHFLRWFSLNERQSSLTSLVHLFYRFSHPVHQTRGTSGFLSFFLILSSDNASSGRWASRKECLLLSSFFSLFQERIEGRS